MRRLWQTILKMHKALSNKFNALNAHLDNLWGPYLQIAYSILCKAMTDCIKTIKNKLECIDSKSNYTEKSM